MKTTLLTLVSVLALTGCANDPEPVRVTYIEEKMTEKLPPEGKWEINNITGLSDLRISRLEVYPDGSKKQIELYQLHQPSTQPLGATP